MFAKVRHGDKVALATDMRDVFRTGQRGYTVEMAWTKWLEMCDNWGADYRAFKLLRNNADYNAMSNIFVQKCNTNKSQSE